MPLTTRPTPTVVFDCDDVLVNLRDPMAEMLNQLTGLGLDWRDWRDYNLMSAYGIGLDLFLQAMVESRVLERAELDPLARPTFSRLREAGYRIEVWTARKWYPDAQAVTLGQLKSLGVAADEVRLFGLDESKAEAAISREDVVGFVDDAPHHIDGLAKGGFAGTALLMDRPWNHALPHARCACLEEAGQVFIDEMQRAA